MKKLAIFPCLLFSLSGLAQTLTIDANKVVAHIPSLIYGAGAEDVNHEIYGGLYDQRIFGEGFEEPALTSIYGWTQYDEEWTIEDGILHLVTNNHGKIVYDEKTFSGGSVSVEVRGNSPRSIAGIIFDVQNPRNGADSFRGYEVSLDYSAGAFVFGKHDNNWQPVARFPLTFSTTEWNSLRVDFNGKQASIFLNGKEIYTYSDESTTPLMLGKIGLRSFGGSASFRNLAADDEEIKMVESNQGLSGMWESVGQGHFEHDSKEHLTGHYSQKITGESGTAIANKGLNKWGIAVKKGQVMPGCIYLKGNIRNAFVALQSTDGSKEYARKKIKGIGKEWKRFAFKMKPSDTDSTARFVVGLDGAGTIWVDQAMLYTKSYPFRSDLTEAFKRQSLTFLRYGGTMVNAAGYLTKNMTGNRELREPYFGHWYRFATNGFAIPEFVAFARLIGAEPTFAINIEDTPEDVLALLKEIEPYHLQYLEIGNEECIGSKALDGYKHYVERYLTLYEAIHRVYPDLKFINASWWRPNEESTMKYVFDHLDGKCDYWDYHPWTETFEQAKATETELKRMQAMFRRWNANSRMKCAILEENGNTHDMARALAHAEMLNVVRRMNGFVAMDSPANALQPYLQNDNGWDQGQIFFSPSSTWNQPPYYAQQIASRTHNPLLVHSYYRDNNALDITATLSESGKRLVVHIVNAQAETREISFHIEGFDKIRSVESYTVSATSLSDRNTPLQPEKIKAIKEKLSPSINTLKVNPFSYTVFIFTK